MGAVTSIAKWVGRSEGVPVPMEQVKINEECIKREVDSVDSNAVIAISGRPNKRDLKEGRLGNLHRRCPFIGRERDRKKGGGQRGGSSRALTPCAGT